MTRKKARTGSKPRTRRRLAAAPEKRAPSGPSLDEVMAILARLRAEDGCPWDKEQTHLSLKPALLEETYELLEAIDKDDPSELAEELGDLLLQVAFHSQVAAEAGRFTLRDVIARLKDKLIRRHPHVFSDRRLSDANAVLKERAAIKAAEKNAGGSGAAALGGVPRSMPALARAQRITERASHLGFDWPRIEPVWDKVAEEMRELWSAAAGDDRRRMQEEIGDLLLALVNLSRFLGLEAESALSSATERFLSRFAHIEARLREAGKSPEAATVEEMDALWEEAKRLERGGEDR